jgi:hypothetical protein
MEKAAPERNGGGQRWLRADLLDLRREHDAFRTRQHNPSPHGERRLARFLLWGEPQNAKKRRECDTQREAGKAGFRGNAARRSRAEPGTFCLAES